MQAAPGCGPRGPHALDRGWDRIQPANPLAVHRRAPFSGAPPAAPHARAAAPNPAAAAALNAAGASALKGARLVSAEPVGRGHLAAGARAGRADSAPAARRVSAPGRAAGASAGRGGGRASAGLARQLGGAQAALGAGALGGICYSRGVAPGGSGGGVRAASASAAAASTPVRLALSADGALLRGRAQAAAAAVAEARAEAAQLGRRLELHASARAEVEAHAAALRASLRALSEEGRRQARRRPPGGAPGADGALALTGAIEGEEDAAARRARAHRSIGLLGPALAGLVAAAGATQADSVEGAPAPTAGEAGGGLPGLAEEARVCLERVDELLAAASRAERGARLRRLAEGTEEEAEGEEDGLALAVLTPDGVAVDASELRLHLPAPQVVRADGRPTEPTPLPRVLRGLRAASEEAEALGARLAMLSARKAALEPGGTARSPQQRPDADANGP